MRELIGTNADILFDLEQIKILSREKTELTKGQQADLDRISNKKAREQAREEMLAKKERRKREFLRMWTLELEDKVKNSGLPSDIVNKILEMTVYARERDMNFIYDIERKIETLKEEVKEAEAKKAAKDAEDAKKMSIAAMGVGVVVAGVALAPFVQVRYTKEEYEKKTAEYYEMKLAKVLAFGAPKERTATPTYATKKGSAYSKRHEKAETEQKTELQNAIVKDIQARQKAAGVTVQSEAEILEKLDRMYPAQRRAAERATYQANPEMKERHEAQKKEVAAQETLNGLLRAKRSSEKAALKALETQKAKLMREARTPETTEQIAARLAALDERIAVRQKEVAALGLFVDNFEKVLKQNNTTASQILSAVTVKGRRNMDVLTDQVMQMNMQGMSMQYAPRNQTMTQTRQPVTEVQDRGISARLKEKTVEDAVEKAKVAAAPGATKKAVDKERMSAMGKALEERARAVWAEKGKVAAAPEVTKKAVDKERMSAMGKALEERARVVWAKKKEKEAKEVASVKKNRRVIRPKLKPKNIIEKQAANELQKIIQDKLAEKGGFRGVLKQNSAQKSEKRVREESQQLRRKSYDRSAA